MAFTNQFSLSLELTKFLPGSSLVNLAGRGLIHLMRELQNSGSDFITEGDLAEILAGTELITNLRARSARQSNILPYTKLPTLQSLSLKPELGPL